MKNILLKQYLPASSQEDNPPSLTDNWARKQLSLHTHELDQHGADIRDIKAMLGELIEETEWKPSIRPALTSRSIEIPLNIKTTFEKLEEDFSDFSNRIIWCNELGLTPENCTIAD